MEQEQEKKLISLVNTFAENKEDMNHLKEVCDRQNAEIKEIMNAENISKFSTDEFTASYTVKQTTKVNDEKVLMVLLQTNAEIFRELGIIKSKEYVDSEALENAIYNSLIDKELLAKIKDCSTTTATPTLTVKRKGKK